MTTSLANMTLDPVQWIDLCALYPATANVDIIIRFLSPQSARIVHGGATAPGSLLDGDALNPGESIYASSDHLWMTGQGAVSVTLL